MNKKPILYSLGHAILTVTYIALVAFVMSNGEKIIGNDVKFIGPVVFLLMFVVSAAMMGILIFGRPVLMYLENQKKQALEFLFMTIGWLFLFLILFFIFLIIF